MQLVHNLIEAASITTSNVQVQLLPNFDFAQPFIFSTSVIETVLAFVIAFLFYRFYRISGLVYLLGLVVGFSFISFSRSLLALNLWESNLEIFNMFFWLKFLSSSYGFSFLALSYYYKGSEEDRVPLMMKIGALSVIPLMMMIAIMVILRPVNGFPPPYNQVDEYFSAFNLFMLGYVFKSAIVSIVEQGRREFIYIPAAFAVLWLGQYSALIFGLDGSVSAFIAEHITKIIGLALFVGVLYQVMRGKTIARRETDI